jgi:agmatine/peptidylarginine deiminase
MKRLIFLIILTCFSLTLWTNHSDEVLRALKENPLLGHYLSYEEIFEPIIVDWDAVTREPTGPVKSIAEFQPMQGVMIRYPFGIPYDVIALMSEEIQVTTVVANQSEENYVISQYNNQGVNLDNCDFMQAPTDSFWIRDYGPFYAISGDNEIGIVDFTYNRPRPNDNNIPSAMAQHFDVPYYNMGLVHTGGNYMSDGRGIAASTDIVWSENSSLTQDQIMQIMNDYQGIETYHVVEDPTGTYIHHIDCWAKYLAPDKILIREVPPSHPQYNQIEQTIQYFENQTSSYGTPYQVVRVNTPNNQPYTNSLILNNRVFVPITGNATHDNAALSVYEDAMPGYEIHGVTGNWLSTDALHCRTKEVADFEMLYIYHDPIIEEQMSTQDYLIEAKIVPLSGAPVFDDSLKVYYRTEEGEYSYEIMTEDEDFWYTAYIPQQISGSTVSYYIHAADASGRSENHPYIGPYDPHTFEVVGPPPQPEIVVEPEIFDITMEEGEIGFEDLMISNIGDEVLEFTISVSENWLSVDPTGAELEAGEDIIIELTINATDLEEGEYESIITINSNDPDNPEVEVLVYLEVTEGTSAEPNLPLANRLFNSYPNPLFLNSTRSDKETMIGYSIKEPNMVTIEVFNIKGQKVRTLINEQTQSGTHSVAWNGRNQTGEQVSSGVYFYRMRTPNYSEIRRMIVIQ